MEFLKEFLTPDLYAKVEEALKGKEDKVVLANLKSNDYVSAAKYAAETKKVEDLKAQIAERDRQIAELGKSAGTIEELKTTIADLQKTNAETAREFEAKLKQQEFDHALSDALKGEYHARDVISVLPHLKTDAIHYEGGKFTGLSEQMAELAKNKAYLFEDVAPSGTGSPSKPPVEQASAFNFGFAAVNTPIGAGGGGK